jgi:hypothetical protein
MISKAPLYKWIVLSIGMVCFGFIHMNMTPSTAHCTRGGRDSRDGDTLFEANNGVFLSAGHCDQCHGYDPTGLYNVSAEGGDINVVDDWSSSIMGNSARDPYWRAKVSQEVSTHPEHQDEIEGLCTKCHAPLGRYAGIMSGVETYHISDMVNDSVALDGVSCLACHQQMPAGNSISHTGQLHFSTNPLAFGPYESPLISPMATATGYNPEYGAHIMDSKLCGSCHSLITETLQPNGTVTGNQFVEQATWHEWLNSSYPANNQSCQSCHLPRLTGQSIQIANGYPAAPRSTYGLHSMAGGNTLMLTMLRDHRTELGIVASENQFNESIAATYSLLQNNSVQLTLPNMQRTADSVFVDVQLKNITGHKLPSGYPARRMTVRFTLSDNEGNVIFQSGTFDSEHRLLEEDATYEPHHNIIRQEDQVQIYEMVMGDVNGNRTSMLTHGASHLKDNRLAPVGFHNNSIVGDTTEIVLNTPDTDFNFNGTEGSGADIIHYHVATNGYQGPLTVRAEVYYQSLPPKWLDGLWTTSTPEVTRFANYYQNADASPVLMRAAQSNIQAFVGIEESNAVVLLRWNGHQLIPTHQGRVAVYNSQGQVVFEATFPSGSPIPLTLSPGAYIAVAENSRRQKQVLRFMIAR